MIATLLLLAESIQNSQSVREDEEKKKIYSVPKSPLCENEVFFFQKLIKPIVRQGPHGSLSVL